MISNQRFKTLFISLCVCTLCLVILHALDNRYEEMISEHPLLRDAEYESCIESCHQYLEDSIGSNVSLCDLESGKRGPGQKVVSFSFYGDLKEKYYVGIAENVKGVQDKYPGWVMRLYIDPVNQNKTSYGELCELRCRNKHFDLCSVRKVTKYGDISSKVGRMWRFLPMADPFVNIVISRDLDSRITDRERAAVDDWLSTGLPFHIMRDADAHAGVILAGMFGARMDIGNREKYSKFIDTIIGKMTNDWKEKHYDEQLLAKYVYPYVKDEACVHDAFHCNRHKVKHNRPWPTRKTTGNRNFVGAAKEERKLATCPLECRPKNHPEWTMC